MNTYKIYNKEIRAVTATAAVRAVFPDARTIRWCRSASDHSYNEFSADDIFPIVVYNIEIAPAKYLP